MGRLITGVSIILFVLVINLLVAFITTGAATATPFEQDCSGNATACSQDAASQASFFSTLKNAAVNPLGDGTPEIISSLWFLIMITLLTTGILLVIFSAVPTLAE